MSRRSAGASVLEVGCGPGQLSVRLARDHGLAVTGLDLDPAMIERARANAEASGVDHETPCPAFVVGDVAAPLHRHVSDPAEHARGLPLRLAA